MPYDVLVVGGGPVGLHAALKAAVLNQSVLLLDKGAAFSRIAQAKTVASIPGRPRISGVDLLEEQRRALREFRDLSGKDLVTFLDATEALHARREGERFVLTVRPLAGGASREVEGRVLVLATGVVDRKPGVRAFEEVGHQTMQPWVHRGAVGYCILCEGWAVEGKRVAVVGRSKDACSVAADLARHFGAEVTLLADERPPTRGADALDEAGVAVDARAVAGIEGDEGDVHVRFAGGAEARFDKVFFSLGWYKVNHALALELGAAVDEDGYVLTDENGEARAEGGGTVRGLFVAGDLRAGRWKQVVVGWGDAETAVLTAYAYRLPDPPLAKRPSEGGAPWT